MKQKRGGTAQWIPNFLSLFYRASPFARFFYAYNKISMKIIAIIIIAILSTGCETVRIQGQGAGEAINTATYGAMCNMTTSLYTCIGVGIVKGWAEGADDERHKIAIEKQKKQEKKGFACKFMDC